MKHPLEFLADRAESDAEAFTDEAITFEARGMGVIANHYRQIAKRRATEAAQLREQIATRDQRKTTP
jgi:hypothetical protein